jgi:ATP-binding cassette subfamily F protein 2
MRRKIRELSGGWRMRVALACAIHTHPDLLLLDEPTNHLDLAACVWLEEYLSTYSKILVIVSHSQDFLNGVCTHTMQLSEQQLRYWGGNYDTYVATKADQDKNTWTLYKKQQDFIKDTKQFISSCGTYSNLVKQAKSRQKMLDKMEEAGLIKAPYSEPLFRFRFPATGALTPPLISFRDVCFSYSGKREDYLFNNVSFGIDADSRISLVGPNGAGKSTLLKLIVGQVQPTFGNISLRAGLVIGRYHQHSAEVLDLEKTPVEYIRDKFQDRYPEKKSEEWRAVVGQWGIPSDYHLRPISHLSEGLKTRLVFCEIATNRPHVLLLDEPTNAADMEMIDSMAEAINNFEGGVVIVSHDFRLLSQTAKEIWVVDHGLKVFDGDIRAYKKTLSKRK